MKNVSLVLRYTKTVKLDVTLSENCEIRDIVISGDFFAYPEDSVEKLENRIKGCASRECIEEAFSELASVVILGVNVEDLKNKIISVYDKCRENLSSKGYFSGDP